MTGAHIWLIARGAFAGRLKWVITGELRRSGNGPGPDHELGLTSSDPLKVRRSICFELTPSQLLPGKVGPGATLA
jgi:hypothetical protein